MGENKAVVNACPCCGSEAQFSDPGTYEICTICNWEDDSVQLQDIDCCGGANAVSLREARATWQASAPEPFAL